MAAPILQLFQRQRDAELNLTFYDARVAYRYTRDFFANNARFINFRKVGGFGSSGIVTLWQALDENNLHLRDVAVKLPVQIYDPLFRMEMSWMAVTFKSCEHFVQLVKLSDHVIAPGAYNDYHNFDGDSGAVMIMEYFSRGELHDILCRINEAASTNPHLPDDQKKLEYIPHRILWRMFLCFAKMCIGMAYPPPPDHNPAVSYKESLPLEEDDEGPKQIMHFDMHPQNIFIERTRFSSEHGYAPRLKLGDFGLCTEWNEDWTNEEKLAAANVGKPGYQAPEQRDERWIVDEYAFGDHTNVWNAGYLMFNATTFYYTDDPEWQPRNCAIQMPDGQVEVISTWAPFLVGLHVYPEFRNYEIELRTLIARCMADNPEDRPTLDELVDIIEENMRRGDEAADAEFRRWEEIRRLDPEAQKPPVDVKTPPAAETNDLMKRWAEEYISEPLSREDPYGEYWDTNIQNL